MVLVERKACFHVTKAFFSRLVGANLAHAQVENLQNVKKCVFGKKGQSHWVKTLRIQELEIGSYFTFMSSKIKVCKTYFFAYFKNVEFFLYHKSHYL